MQTIGAFQAKTHFSSLLEQVEQGAQVVITKHGHPVAKLVPYKEQQNQQQVKMVIDQMKIFAQKHSLGKLDWKTLRDEGRR